MHSMCIRLMYSTYIVLHCLHRHRICGESAARCTGIGCFGCGQHDAQDRNKSRDTQQYVTEPHFNTHTHKHTHTRTQMLSHTFMHIPTPTHLLHLLHYTHTHTHTYVHAYTHAHVHAHLLSLLHLDHMRLSLCLGYKFSKVSITAILYT